MNVPDTLLYSNCSCELVGCDFFYLYLIKLRFFKRASFYNAPLHTGLLMIIPIYLRSPGETKYSSQRNVLIIIELKIYSEACNFKKQ
jgi:hypothetical protein